MAAGSPSSHAADGAGRATRATIRSVVPAFRALTGWERAQAPEGEGWNGRQATALARGDHQSGGNHADNTREQGKTDLRTESWGTPGEIGTVI